MRRVALTGAGGLVGSALRATRPADLDLRGQTGADAPEAGLRIADVTDADAMAELLEGAEVLLHVAGPPSVAASFADPAGFAAAHVVGTATLLRAAVAAGVRRVVYLSSAEVYGRGGQGVRETQSLAPRSPYGAAKLGAEALCQAAHRAAQLEVVILRPFSVYGDRLRRNSVLGDIFSQLAAGQSRIALRDPRPVRDHVHAEDLARAIWTAAWDPGTGDEAEIFNIGSGQGVSVATLAEIAGAALGRRVEVVASAAPDRPGAADIAELVADITAARRRLGWTPEIALEQGLRRAFDRFCRGCDGGAG